MATAFDAIVIGAGVAGAAISDALCRHGIRVALIERGEDHSPFESPSEVAHYFRLEQAGASVPQVAIDEAAHSGVRRTEPQWWMKCGVGGGSLHWYGHMGRLKQEDFEIATYFRRRRAPIDPGLIDWPISFAEMQPWYDMAERELGAVDVDAAPNTAAAGSLRAHAQERSLRAVLDDVGLDTYYIKSVGGGRLADLLRATWGASGHTDNSSVLYSQRPTTRSSFVERARCSGNLTLMTRQVALRLRHQDRHVVGVELCDARGERSQPKVLHAPIVVLACSPLESVRLALNSAVGNPDLVGKHFLSNTEMSADCTLELERDDELDRRSPPYIGSLSSDFYYFIHDEDHPELLKGGKISITDRWWSDPPVYRLLKQRKFGRALREQIDRDRNYLSLHLSFKGESIPTGSKSVTLSTRTDCYGIPLAAVSQPCHPHDTALRQFMSQELRGLCEKLPSFRDTITVSASERPVLPSAHHYGGLRMAEDCRYGVTNRFCEFHGVRGLFAVDGSCKPSTGGTNSSLTTIANALRVGFYIAAEHSS